MAKTLVIIGADQALAAAIEVAQAQGLAYLPIALNSGDRYNFDAADALAMHPPAETDVFAALDERAVNYARLKLLTEVRLAGYSTINLVSPRANVAAGTRLLGNVLVEAGAAIGNNNQIGSGTWIGLNASIGADARIGTAATIREGVIIGKSATIGAGTTLGPGSIIADQAKIGRHCEWLIAGKLPVNLPDRTFHDDLFPEGARVFSFDPSPAN